jgi:general secretion pathway protein D
VTLSSLGRSAGFGGLPTFGNREITTTIRLKDGETNMLAGLIRDEERTVLSGVPGLSDIPMLGRLFAHNHRETQQTDIILTLTPHIVRILDLTEADLRSFRLGREAGTASLAEILGGPGQTPRDEAFEQPARSQPPAAPAQPPGPPPVSFPQPLVGRLPGTNYPVTVPPKKPGGGGGS